MENKLTDVALKLKAVIDTAIDGIITIDDKGLVETINFAAGNLFGYAPDEVVGNNIKMLMPEPYHGEHDGYIRRYKKTKEPRIIGIGREVIGLKKEGSVFPFRLAVSEVILNDRVIFAGIIHDLTAIKESQAQIEKLNKQLEQKVADRTYELEKVVNQLLATNKNLSVEIKERKRITEKLKSQEEELIHALETERELNELKSRFVSMASHEFRTPLTSIRSSAALISKYPDTSQFDNREKHVKRIKSAVVNLTGILNDFLSLSKLEEGKTEVHYRKLDLNNLCHDVIEDVKSLLKSDQLIIHEIHGERTNVEVDERILRNILFNLVSNAIKYSSQDIKCDIYFHDEYFEFQIQDSGIGIPQEDQKHLFSRFFRASNVVNIQGTGLGLNIVKRYVNLLNGEISFESEYQVGTTFFVKIPYKAD